MMIDGKTRVYGILGNPVRHSLSPVMHNAAYAECGLNCVYLPFPTTDVAAALQGIRHLGIRGASVTIPHKETVIKFLDRIDPVAAKIGSVNTIHCLYEGDSVVLHGSNTDWIGANMALGEQMQLKNTDIVILGAGGSARAIGFGLLEAGAKITFCSRSANRGQRLAAELGCSWVPIAEAGRLKGDALVNATSVGMTPDSDNSPADPETIRNFPVVMDIVYSPLKTRLLEECEKAGCKTVNGLEMLLHQGAAQFELWMGADAPVEVMREALMRITGNS